MDAMMNTAPPWMHGRTSQPGALRELDPHEIEHISGGNPLFFFVAGAAAGAVVGEFFVGFVDGLIAGFQD